MNKYIFLFLVLLYFHTATLGQSSVNSPLLKTEVSLNYSGVSLYKILNDIQEKYKINFYYSNNLIPLDHKVSIDIKNQPLDKVLDLLFEGPSIKYKVVGEQIVLIKATKETSENPDPIKASTSPNQKNDLAVIKMDKKENSTSAVSNKKNEEFKNIREWKVAHRAEKKYLIKKTNKDTTSLADTISKNDDKKNFKEYNIFKPREKSFSLDMNLTLGTSYRKLTSGIKEGKDVIKKRDGERPKFAFISEIQLSYHLKSPLSISAGLGYMNLGEKGKYKDSSGYCNSYSYLTLPISSYYNFDKGKFSILTGFALIPAKLISKGKYLQYDILGKPPKVIIAYRDFNVAYSLYVQGSYRSGNFTYSAGLHYREFIFSTYNKSSTIREINHLIGLQASINYHFSN